MLARLQNTDEKKKADNYDGRETKTREAHKTKSVASRESKNLRRVLNLFCASVFLELCSTEIESSYSADFALQFGKA